MLIVTLSLLGSVSAGASPDEPYYGDELSGLAKRNRLGFSFGGGLGWASFTRFHNGVERFSAQITELNPTLLLSEVPKSELFGLWQLGLRYYSPVRFFAQVDLAFLHNQASSDLIFADSSRGKLSNINLMVEASLVVGYYRIIGDRFYLYAGLGPTVIFMARSYWHYDRGEMSDFSPPHGGGFHVVAGFEVMVSKTISLGLEVRYRYIGTGELEPLGVSYPPVPPVDEIALSGVAPTLFLRWFTWDFGRLR